MPRSIWWFSIRNLNDPNTYPHTNKRSMMFSRTFSGLYWSVKNSHSTVGACRRLAQFTRRLLPVLVHIPVATTVQKIASITRFSHIVSWNAYWLGCTTVRLHWIASACAYCIPINHTTIRVWSLPVHLHQVTTQSSSPPPSFCATILPKNDTSISILRTLALLR